MNVAIVGQQKVSGAIGVELIIAAGAQKVYLNDIAILRNKQIKHIDICNELSTTLTGNNINAAPGYITLKCGRSNQYAFTKLPIQHLLTSVRKGNRICMNNTFDLAQSFIELSVATMMQTSIYFVFWYSEPGVRNLDGRNKTIQIDSFELKLEGQRTQFKDNRTLGRRRFKSLLLSFPLLTPENNASINDATSKKIFLTLQRNNLQFFQKVPVYLFNQMNTAYFIELENISFDFTNSYIEVRNPLAADLKSVFFNCQIESL